MAGGPVGIDPRLSALLAQGNAPSPNNFPTSYGDENRLPFGMTNFPNSRVSNSQSQQGPAAPGLPSFQSYLNAMGINLGDNAGPDLTAGVAGQYNPLLAHLRKSIGRTKKEAKKSDKNLAEIYSAMAKMDQKDAAKIQKQGNRSTREIKDRFASGSQRVDAMNRRMEQDVVDRNAALGIEDATASAVNPLQRQARAAQIDLNTRSADQVSASKSNTNNWSNFARSAAINSRLAGANQRADLAGQLSDVLFGIRGQIADTQAQKAGAMLSAQQSMADSGTANDSLRASLFGNYTDTLAAQQAAGQKDPVQLQGYDAAKQGISQYLRGVNKTDPSYDANIPNDISSIMNTLMQTGAGAANQPDAMGKVNPTTIQDFIAQLQAAAKSKNYRPESMNAIMNVAPDLFQYLQKGSGING